MRSPTIIMTAPDWREARSLYDTLESAAPIADRDEDGGGGGETAITATKETMDNDTEEISDDDILNL
jgi:hypothetical protein